MLASLLVESDKNGPRTDIMYPVVETIIIDFSDERCL